MGALSAGGVSTACATPTRATKEEHTMVKKLKKMAEQKSSSPAGLLDSQLAGAVKASAQQIWLAGMGAFAKAQGEGTKVFEALIKEGVSLQRKRQAMAEERIGEVTAKISAMAGPRRRWESWACPPRRTWRP